MTEKKFNSLVKKIEKAISIKTKKVNLGYDDFQDLKQDIYIYIYENYEKSLSKNYSDDNFILSYTEYGVKQYLKNILKHESYEEDIHVSCYNDFVLEKILLKETIDNVKKKYFNKKYQSLIDYWLDGKSLQNISSLLDIKINTIYVKIAFFKKMVYREYVQA